MRLMFGTALATFVIDQLTKLVVVHLLDLRSRGEIEVLPPLLSFRMAWNRGINFGWLAGDGWLSVWGLVILALAIVALVLVWAWREPPGPAGLVSAGLLVGGALGNVTDRLIYGAVADFLNMSCCGLENPYAFNIADVAIFAGAVGLMLFGGRPAAGAKGGNNGGGPGSDSGGKDGKKGA